MQESGFNLASITKHTGERIVKLAALKLTNTRKPTQQPAIIQQRNKLAKRIWEQMELAKAQASGGTFASKRLISIKGDDGIRRTVETAKRVKPWWFAAENGKVCLNIRYGAKLIELAKGKTAIEVANAEELLKVLDIVKAAVIDGELDQQIEAASGQLRAGFKR
jgi:hypothetical protein